MKEIFLAMGEVEEQRYVCKICSKSCVSGKSLGGHMRSHLALISASKNAAKAEAEIKIDYHQSNSAFPSEENMKNCDSNTDYEDGDQNNSYELRENPKKSWRISDPKHGVIKNGNTCKECAKEFPSMRALSGHMRCHSIKNKKQVHQCKKCGKGFDSIKAMFGHMKTHSKKLMVVNESTDSLSDLENFCPVRRKRSRIRYKSSPNPSFSDLNVSTSAVYELGEAEEAATCLIMLSRGVRDSLKFDKESFDDYDSVYFGADQSSKRFSEYDIHLVSDVETKKLDYYLSGYGKGFTGKNVAEFDYLDSKFDAEDQTNVDTQVSDDDFVNDDGWVSVHKVLKTEQVYEFDHSRSSGSTKSAELFELNSGKKVITCVYESDSEKTSSANLEILEHYEKRNTQGTVNLELGERKVYECLTCFKVFSSGQALGGHKRAHYNASNESNNQEAMVTNQEVAQVQDAFDLNFAVNGDESIRSEVGISSWWTD